MTLTLRIDDYPGSKENEFGQHNMLNFKIFHSYLQKWNIDYTLGVIPGYTPPKDLLWFKEHPEITVAMHGVVHNESSLDEFGGLRYADIENTILTTKNQLEAFLGTRVADYIPPHNTLNGDTILALSRLGFDRIYGGPETTEEMQRAVRFCGVEYVHSEAPLEYGRTDELLERGAVQHLKETCRKHDVCLTLHWPWEWNIGLTHLDCFLGEIHELF